MLTPVPCVPSGSDPTGFRTSSQSVRRWTLPPLRMEVTVRSSTSGRSGPHPGAADRTQVDFCAPVRRFGRREEMSVPRRIVPGRVYMVTRRCTQRQFLLRPDRETTNAFIYCLAVAAQRTERDVLAFLAHSNHHHTIVVDTRGRCPSSWNSSTSWSPSTRTPSAAIGRTSGQRRRLRWSSCSAPMTSWIRWPTR